MTSFHSTTTRNRGVGDRGCKIWISKVRGQGAKSLGHYQVPLQRTWSNDVKLLVRLVLLSPFNLWAVVGTIKYWVTLTRRPVFVVVVELLGGTLSVIRWTITSSSWLITWLTSLTGNHNFLCWGRVSVKLCISLHRSFIDLMAPASDNESDCWRSLWSTQRSLGGMEMVAEMKESEGQLFSWPWVIIPREEGDKNM